MEDILNLENWRKFGNDWVGYYIYPNNNIKYYKDSANCSIFYISINKIITK